MSAKVLRHSCHETAAIMTKRGYPMSPSRVWRLERTALEKMSRHPIFQEIARAMGRDGTFQPNRQRRANHG